MNASPRSSHAEHDELLIARLHGDDLSDAERAVALERIAVCDGCASLLTDMQSIAAAMSALPAEPRPRSFTLTVEQAAAATPRGRRWLAELAGWTRPLGGVLTAAGLAGVLVFGGGRGLVGTLATGGAQSAATAGEARAPAYYGPAGASQGQAAADGNVGAVPSPAATAAAGGAASQLPAAPASSASTAFSASAAPAPAATASPALAVASAASSSAAPGSASTKDAQAGYVAPTNDVHGQQGGTGPAENGSKAPAGGPVPVAGPAGQSSTDPGLIALAASLVAVALGVVLLVGGMMRARRR